MSSAYTSVHNLATHICHLPYNCHLHSQWARLRHTKVACHIHVSFAPALAETRRSGSFFYFILFYFILFYFILFYFILFYFILFYFILFYFILFYFILFYFISFHFTLVVEPRSSASGLDRSTQQGELRSSAMSGGTDRREDEQVPQFYGRIDEKFAEWEN